MNFTNIRRLLASFISITLMLTTTACSGQPTSSGPAGVSSPASSSAPLFSLVSAPSPGPRTAAMQPQTTAATASSASNLSSCALAAPVPASSKLISKITVTFYGDASTGRGFTWYTNKTSKQSCVKIVEKTGTVPDFSKASMVKGTVSASHNSPSEIVHKAAVTGLKSNASYYYCVGDAALNLWSDPGVFTTAPTSGPFTFIDLSDTQFAGQAGANAVAATLSSALAQSGSASFIINNGDVVDSKSESQWNMLLKSSGPSLTNTTIMPAAGNHDSGNSTFIDHFNLNTPEKSTSTGAYYSVNYSNAHFIVLNTNESSGSYAEFSPAQIAWMKADISAAKKNGAKWSIVVMHMGPYTTAEHVNNSNIISTRKSIAPLFNELGVDLVLQGHDHVYARSKPIKNSTASPESVVIQTDNGVSVKYITNPNGPVYLTPGTAGTKHYYQNDSLSQSYLSLFDVANGPYKGDPNLNSEETFVSVKIDGDRLTATAYQISKTSNNNAPYVIDRFGILKSSN